MSDILKKSGLNQLKQGDSVIPRDIFNSLIENSDQNTEALDEQLKGFFNLNTYQGDYGTRFELDEALSLVPKNRVWPGMILRFLSKSGHYVDYIFTGQFSGKVKPDIIENVSLWVPREADVIDGGVW